MDRARVKGLLGFLSRLKLKETAGLDLDDPATTLLHARLLQQKGFLKALYLAWYRDLERLAATAPPGKKVEIGSGGGCIKAVMADVITSDILPLPHVDLQFSADQLPFAAGEVSVFFMLNTLHHLPAAPEFFAEAVRCLRPGGRILCIEPAVTPMSRLIYTHFHHEPFDPKGTWQLEPGRPLSAANQALPWILFCRDRDQFEARFPQLVVRRLTYHTPFRYLLSGGFSYPAMVPAWSHDAVEAMEKLLSPLNGLLALFLTAELEKTG